MNDSDFPSDFLPDHLNDKRARKAVSRIEADALDFARQDAKQAAELHVAHLAGEITRDTAELNSYWCDLHRTDSDMEWRFEAIWQAVQHHLSRAGLYPAGDEQEARLYADFACHLSTFWLRTYANSDVIPNNVASEVRHLYDEDDFWPVYRAWYDVQAQRPGTIA
ncbi:hypothetical protein [Salinibacter ruber]|uniref:hypothetical protein n=1 Tax=Salinibacter ruber TaxID=146919 RepID=UPI000E593692|nr:hypothetical protein [Salinibacter ruber]